MQQVRRGSKWRGAAWVSWCARWVTECYSRSFPFWSGGCRTPRPQPAKGSAQGFGKCWTTSAESSCQSTWASCYLVSRLHCVMMTQLSDRYVLVTGHFVPFCQVYSSGERDALTADHCGAGAAVFSVVAHLCQHKSQKHIQQMQVPLFYSFTCFLSASIV